MTQEALKLALAALEKNTKHLPVHFDDHFEAITAIKEALAQKQEPIAMLFGSLPVYDHTTPPQRTWVGLDEVEIVGCTCECIDVGEFNMSCAIDFARAIEAKLKERNTNGQA